MYQITKTFNICKFDELSDDAKSRVKNFHMGLFGFHGAEEALDSIRKLSLHFGGRVRNYQADWFATTYSSMSFEMPEMEREEIERRLSALGTYNEETFKGNGDCLLTGVCYDEDAIDGFRIAFLHGESDLDKLMQEAFKTWLASCQSECECFYEDDEFGEYCDANENEFYEDGKLYRKERKTR